MTATRRTIVREKRFLHALYVEWYKLIIGSLDRKDQVLELGSGAGFLKDWLPDLISSDVFPVEGIDRVVDACDLPFDAESLDAIVMTDVFHHIPDVALFLKEAIRTLRPGGKVCMIEPWRTPWSEWIYTHLHHEPFLPESKKWALDFQEDAPLSNANGALPWMVFERDRALFEKKFPELVIQVVKPLMPLAYLLSGGVSMRSVLPGFTYSWIRWVERNGGESQWAMFALIVVKKKT